MTIRRKELGRTIKVKWNVTWSSPIEMLKKAGENNNKLTIVSGIAVVPDSVMVHITQTDDLDFNIQLVGLDRSGKIFQAMPMTIVGSHRTQLDIKQPENGACMGI